MNDKTEHRTALTKNQKLVLSALVGAGQPLGAYALLDELREHGFKAPLQVYRALEQLLELGLVHRLECLNVCTVFCEAKHANTPVFAICNDCGIVTEHFDKQLSKSLETMSRRTGFMPDRSIIEIHGQCNSCSPHSNL